MQELSIHSINKIYKVFIPEKWEELTIKQIIEIDQLWREKPDVLKAFAILTGLSLKITENITDKNIEKKIFVLLAFLNNTPDWAKMKKPNKIKIGDRSYKVPSKIGNFMYGQKIMLLQSVETIEELIEKMPLAISIMMQPIIDRVKNKGKEIYSSERVEELEQIIMKSNGLDCYALAQFFFARLGNFASIGTDDLIQFRESINPTNQLSKNWLKVKD